MNKLLVVVASLVALLVPASMASAAPTGPYAKFAQCPIPANPGACLYSKNTSGSFQMGAKTVPIVNPVVLQGGLEITGPGENQFRGAKNGDTLSKTPQPVPGGLTGIVAPSWWPSILRDLFNETINNGFTGVQATVELAAPATSIKVDPLASLSGSGTAVYLPVKVKLSNPFLGSNCYLGSNSNPMKLNFTTGTTAPPPPNKPISGSPGTFAEEAEGTIISQKGVKLVDNSFAAPGANGCGGLFSFLVDPFVNSIVGVPSAAGTNTGILSGDIYLAEPSAVWASE